jgi:hypothetical protein
MGGGDACFQDSKTILREFGSTAAEARRRLVEWMRAEIDPVADAPERALAPEFDWHDAPGAGRETNALSERSPQEGRVRSRRTLPAEPEWSLPALIARVCAARDVPMDELLVGVRTRSVSDARAEIVYRACAELRLAGVAVARALGLSKAAVSQARARGRTLLESKREESGQKQLNF